MKEFLQKQYQLIAGIIIFVIILSKGIDFHHAIILLLEFIVILEVVKMISDFIEKNKLSLRFIIDVFIVFLIRDVVILITQSHMNHKKILFLVLIIFIFFLFRLLAIIYSPLLYKKGNKK